MDTLSPSFLTPEFNVVSVGGSKHQKNSMEASTPQIDHQRLFNQGYDGANNNVIRQLADNSSQQKKN